MLQTFLITLNPMLTLFLCIAVGFLARKSKILPDNAGTTMAKLETWIFCPALNFITMARFFTVASIRTHARNILLAVVCVALSLAIAVVLSRLFVRKKCAERGIYQYALTFANGGYVGDPVVLALFGDIGLSYYKLFYLPFTLTINTWGISVLVPGGTEKKSVFRKILNAPTVSLLCGILVGVTGLGAHLPTFAVNALDSLKSCMGPVAMLLAGFTVAGYDFKKMVGNKKVYAATLLRLTVLPAVLVAALLGIKTLCNVAFGMAIDHSVLYLLFFAQACALGMNTIVFPAAYGGNPETGASMTLISHTLAVITIPVMYAAMIALFGTVSFG